MVKAYEHISKLCTSVGDHNESANYYKKIFRAQKDKDFIKK